jgi:hypothetical protein
MKAPAEPSVPAQVRPAYDAIVRLTDLFCQARLTHEYQTFCRKLAGVLARKRPSPITRGKPEVWACAVVRVIGWVNFLDDSSAKLHIKMTAIDKKFGVSSDTGQSKSKAIRNMLKIRQFDPTWTLPSQQEKNPMGWMIQVNGFVLDARYLRREIQEQAYQSGLIPFVPSTRPIDSLAIRCEGEELAPSDQQPGQ